VVGLTVSLRSQRMSTCEAVTADARRQHFMPKPIQEITAKTAVSSNGSITQFKGDVTITIPGAVIYADEATMDATSNQVDLRGNVRMRLTPAPISK
jgi:lipopolysaccharide assembly outer membrane protein LptD (OstA)